MTQLAVQWDEGKYSIQKRLGDFVQFFQVGFPTNSLGVPSKLVLPAPLLENLLDYENTDDVPDEVLEIATVAIEYHDGIPTVDGLPIWEKLEGETIPHYNLFKEYRDMIALHGTRSMVKVADNHQILSKYVSALAKVYNWSLRCKVYDAIKSIEAERKRQYQIEKLSNRHSEVAAKMLEQGMEYLEAHPEQMNPKLALQMVETAMKAGRLALGLSGDKPGAEGAATNINIHQSAGFATGGGEVEMTQQGSQGGAKQADTDYLQSILHVLDTSGAFEQAKGKIIEASYEEVTDEDPAVGGL